MSNVFSSEEQLLNIVSILNGYLKLPLSEKSVPGSLMENVISQVRHGKVLNTYDFVDVIDTKNKVGWQVKSTMASTVITWKRAKIPKSAELIKESHLSESGLQKLGDTIIKFCNDHAEQSMSIYGLNEIGFSRLIVHKDKKLSFYEKILCTKENPKIFNESDFVWQWSVAKKTKGKEQLSALHGTNKETGAKWFAWHGLGENQLHFIGEKTWWPDNGHHRIDFDFPTDRLTGEQLIEFLKEISVAT